MMSTADEVTRAVFSAAKTIVHNVPMTMETTIHADLGMNSLDVMEFLMEIEESLDMDLDAVEDAAIEEETTLGQLIDRIRSMRA